MKILHVCKKYPNALGGDAIVVANLQKHQGANGHKVVIVTSNCDEIKNGKGIYRVGLRDTPSGLDVISPRRIISLMILAFRMPGILKKEKPDVIHTHSIDMALVSSFAARLYRIPMIHTFHIVTFYDNNQSAFRRMSELGLARWAGLHRVTAPNVYDVDKLQRAGLIQTVLLPNGVDAAWWQTHERPEKSKEFTFLAVGRLEPQKGYEYLVKAAAMLARTGSRAFRVVIVGEGSQKHMLQKLIHRLHVGDVVTLAGLKSPDEVRVLMAAADAAVIPSLYETTPITLLEAWAAGIPAIITSVGIVRHAPADFGAAYIVSPKNKYALMETMERCMENAPLRRAIAAKGQIEAGRYAWSTVAGAAESIYRSVI